MTRLPRSPTADLATIGPRAIYHRPPSQAPRALYYRSPRPIYTWCRISELAERPWQVGPETYVTPRSQGHPGQNHPTRWAADRSHKERYRSISSDRTKRLPRPRHQGKVFLRFRRIQSTHDCIQFPISLKIFNPCLLGSTQPAPLRPPLLYFFHIAWLSWHYPFALFSDPGQLLLRPARAGPDAGPRLLRLGAADTKPGPANSDDSLSHPRLTSLLGVLAAISRHNATKGRD